MARLLSAFRIAILACLVAVLCYLAAYVAGMLTLVDSVHRPERLFPLWPGCALLLAVLLRQPKKLWALLMVAGFSGFVLYDLRMGLSLRSIGVLLLADTVEVLVAACGVEYFLDRPVLLNSLNSLARYSLFAVILAPISGAFVGAATYGRFYWANWRSSFLSESLALMTVTPAILCWMGPGQNTSKRRRPTYYLEAGILTAGLLVFGYVTFIYSDSSSWPGLQYTIIPFFLWAVLGFGIRGISTSVVIVAFLSVWGTTHGRGPFTGPEPMRNVLSLQLFLLCAAVPFSILAVFVEERERTQETLLNLSHRLIEAHEQERAQIARELHDDICQRLATLLLRIEKVTRISASQETSVTDHLEKIWAQCSTLAGDVQALSHELHPSILDNLGLTAAVKSFCRELSEQSGATVEFTDTNIPDTLPREVSLSLFRVIQEALHNAVKYSGEKRFEVYLHGRPGEIDLEVSDRGVGFDVSRASGNRGLGLVNMAERVHLVNGTFNVDSQLNGGTRIRVRVPLGTKSKAPTSYAN
jgi:signal transduction histidine kinase